MRFRRFPRGQSLRSGPLLRGRHGGLEKRGGRKSSRRTPLPNLKGFWAPLRLVRFPPPQVSLLYFFLNKKSKREQTRNSFGGLQNFFGRVRRLVRFPPSIRFAPPISWPNLRSKNAAFCICVSKGPLRSVETWKLGFINRVLVAVIFEASKCL